MNFINSLFEKGRLFLQDEPLARFLPRTPETLENLSLMLLTNRGEAKGVALASEVFVRLNQATSQEKKNYLLFLANTCGADPKKLQEASQAYLSNPSSENATALHQLSEPKRQEILRRLNLAPQGTQNLIRLREELFKHLGNDPSLASLDNDFRHLFTSWFNLGFLTLRQIDWKTPANILEKIIRYEAVHAIGDWDDLRARIEPSDRRLFAFFHPQIDDEPLIFVEVALCASTPHSVQKLLDRKRVTLARSEINTACFYSISNCQEGLRGISFGNFLIKQVVETLSAEFNTIKTFVTLSPLPLFAKNVQKTQDLRADAARYLLKMKTKSNRPVDPVARFHLGNGATLAAIHLNADISDKGLQESHGLMVNYHYDLKTIVDNHENYAETGSIAVVSNIAKLVNSD